MLTVFTSLLLVFSSFADQKTEYTMSLSCACVIYNDDMVLIEEITSPFNYANFVFGSATSFSSAEAQLCAEDMLENLSLSCSRAYARAQGQCQQRAKLYNSETSPSPMFFVDPMSCIQQVESF